MRQQAQAGVHTLPPLPYAEDALAPVISANTLGFHYGKHHKGYVDALNGLLKGHRLTIAAALATLSVATLLRFLPPAATKLLIDNVLLGKAPPGWLPGWVPVPSRPERRLLLLAAVVLAVSAVGTAVGLWGRWLATRTAKRLQVLVRRRVFEHAARLPLHRIYQLKAGGAKSSATTTPTPSSQPASSA